jgi:hypothetical protein
VDLVVSRRQCPRHQVCIVAHTTGLRRVLAGDYVPGECGLQRGSSRVVNSFLHPG